MENPAYLWRDFFDADWNYFFFMDSQVEYMDS